LHENSENSVAENAGIIDAKKIAEKLGIPHYVVEYKNEFKKNVIDYFVKSYLNGLTPNPCIMCNPSIKWRLMLETADKFGAHYMATGHYAKVVYNDQTKRYSIKKSITEEKDQTYMLYRLSQHQLSRTLTPVGNYTKDHIREIAKKIDVDIAKKKDSQEVCFIPDNDYGNFIRQYIEKENLSGEFGEGKELKEILPGNFIDVNNNIIGKHKGIPFYTIGQRKGLGVIHEKPLYVKEINSETNEIVLAENESLFNNKFFITDVNYMSIESVGHEMQVKGKIRYSHKPELCTIKAAGTASGKIECTFENNVRAITKGQSAVFYQDDIIVCGGIIAGG